MSKMPVPFGAGIAACQKSPLGLFDKGWTTLFARTHAPCRAGPMCPAAECALIPAGRCGHRPLRKDRRVHPHIGRRGRLPAVERSGTNALGVRRPVSAAVPRCETPSGRGAVGAADWGGGNRVESLPPPALRAATSLVEGGKERRIPAPVFALARNDSASRCLGGQSRPPLQTPSASASRCHLPRRGRQGRSVSPCAAGHMGPALRPPICATVQVL